MTTLLIKVIVYVAFKFYYPDPFDKGNSIALKFNYHDDPFNKGNSICSFKVQLPRTLLIKVIVYVALKFNYHDLLDKGYSICSFKVQLP